MRCRKWWWSIFLFSLGAGATNAYLVYLSACEAEGLRKKDIKSHREFLEELCEQLCHPELRVREATTKPPEREMERPSPAREERKERAKRRSARREAEAETFSDASVVKVLIPQRFSQGRTH